MRGNAIDLAVGVVIGAGFNAIVSSLVDDIIMPPLSLLVGNVDFSQKQIVLQQATENTEGIFLTYGNFINAIFEFLLVAFAIFLFIRWMNQLWRKEEEVKEEASSAVSCPHCKMEVNPEATRCPHCTAKITPQS